MFTKVTSNVWRKHLDLKKFSMSSNFFNFYKVLGVPSTASAEDIKRSYISKCKEYHPDRHSGDTAMQKRFVKVNEAYDTLRHVSKRREYDLLHISPNERMNRNPRSEHAWGGPKATPDHVWREWKKSTPHKSSADRWESRRQDWVRREQFWQERDMKNAKRKNSQRGFYYKDPLNDYWDHVYQNQDRSQRHTSKSDNINMAEKEKLAIIMFFIGLGIIIFIRITMSYRSLSQQQMYEQETDFYVQSKKDKTNKDANTHNSTKIDPELELKTENV